MDEASTTGLAYLRDVLVLCCRGCNNISHCYRRLVPVLRCGYSADRFDSLLRGLDEELEAGAIRHLGIVAAQGMDVGALSKLVYIASTGLPEHKITLFMPLELFMSLIAHDNAHKLLGRVHTSYIYVTRLRDLCVVQKLSSSKPLSRYKGYLAVLYYATSPEDVSEALSSYTWCSPPRLGLVVDEATLTSIKSIVLEYSYRFVERQGMLGIQLEKYVDPATERLLEILVLRKEPEISLHIVHPAGVIRIRVRPSTLERGEEESVIPRLCRALWRARLEVVIDGVTCVDTRLVRALSMLQQLPTLRAATEATGVSYPTLKRLLTLAERMLGAKLVDVYRGGVMRGGAQLTIEGMKLLKFYSKVVRRVEEELQRIVEEVCREMIEDGSQSE